MHISSFQKFKDVTWPWPGPFKGQFVIPMLNRHLANQCTKFVGSIFSHSWDMDKAPKLKWVTWRNHAPFRTVCSPYAGTSYDRPLYQIWNLYVYLLQGYERWRKCKKWVVWWLGVTQGHQQHTHSMIQYSAYHFLFNINIQYASILYRGRNLGGQRGTVPPPTITEVSGNVVVTVG